MLLAELVEDVRGVGTTVLCECRGDHLEGASVVVDDDLLLPCDGTRIFSQILLSSISIAPPPPTTLVFFIALRTIMMASWSERSASSINCCAPPRIMIVDDLVPEHCLKRLYRSPPICFS